MTMWFTVWLLKSGNKVIVSPPIETVLERFPSQLRVRRDRDAMFRSLGSMIDRLDSMSDGRGFYVLSRVNGDVWNITATM